MSDSTQALSRSKSGENSSDLLLWMAAVVVAVVGAAWLWMAKPWADGDSGATVVRQPSVTSTAAPSNPAPASSADDPVAIENWLRMAQLASEAGMLVEPENYSAWALFGRALDAAPGNAQALLGLNSVADALAERGRVALEQGRLDDAAQLRDLISARLPAHAGAAMLDRELTATRQREAEARAERQRLAAAEADRQRSAASASVAGVQANPIKDVFGAFQLAVSENRLLTPSGDNAKQYLDELIATDASHELTGQARRVFFDQLLARAKPAIEALDTQAATTWIDQAAALDVDPQAIEAARSALTEKLVESESKRLIPATDLELVSYTPPEYPTRAATRGLEGWVDIEFVVGTDGRTRDVTITNASNDALFGESAMAAVEQWQFRPRSFMGRDIEQRAFTRIRFALQ